MLPSSKFSAAYQSAVADAPRTLVERDGGFLAGGAAGGLR